MVTPKYVVFSYTTKAEKEATREMWETTSKAFVGDKAALMSYAREMMKTRELAAAEASIRLLSKHMFGEQLKLQHTCSLNYMINKSNSTTIAGADTQVKYLNTNQPAKRLRRLKDLKQLKPDDPLESPFHPNMVTLNYCYK